MKTIERVALVIALVLALLGVLLPASQPAAPTVVGSQGLTFGTSNFGGSISVAEDAAIGDDLTVTGSSALNGGASIANGLTISGLVQYPFAFFGNDSSVNGTMIAHGLGATPTYPWCMVYDADWVTATARISATNATSVTLAIFGTDGQPWTTPGVPVRCGAVHVP